jgi:hypothetical protein
MKNEYGDKVTLISVMRVFTYEVDFIAQHLGIAPRNGDAPTLEDVLDRIGELATEEFNSKARRGELIYTDEHGNNY